MEHHFVNIIEFTNGPVLDVIQVLNIVLIYNKIWSYSNSYKTYGGIPRVTAELMTNSCLVPQYRSFMNAGTRCFWVKNRNRVDIWWQRSSASLPSLIWNVVCTSPTSTEYSVNGVQGQVPTLCEVKSRKDVTKLSTVMSPMIEVLKFDTAWFWGLDQQKAFEKVKEMLAIFILTPAPMN